MLNNIVVKDILMLFVAVFAQVLIFNQLDFFYNSFPLIYILWIYFFPIYKNPFQFLFLSFLLGLFVDLFIGTGGIHAFSCVMIAFLRKPFLRFISSADFEFTDFSFNSLSRIQKFTFLLVLIICHHLCVFLLDNFKWTNLFIQFQKVIITSFITLVFCYILIFLFSLKSSK